MGKKRVTCPAEAAIQVIGGRWKLLVLQQLVTGVKRFSELHQALGTVSHRTLTHQLRELSRMGSFAERYTVRFRRRSSTHLPMSARR